MYQKIFVPVDESRPAMGALKEACELACSLGKASLHIVHVVDLAQFSWGGTGYLRSSEVHEASKEVASKILNNASKIISEYNLNCTTEILESAGEKISSLLAESAKRNECDLVVMGTHGFSGVMHLLMGSVAEGVLRQVEVPVMLVRHVDEV